MGARKNYIVLGSYLYLWDGDNLYCIVFILIEVRLFILYSNLYLYLYLWEETICDTTLGVAAPIIRSAAANSYMYDIHYIHIIHIYSYIEFIYYTYVISSVRSSYSHPDLLLTQHPLFQITPVLNTGLSLSEPLQLYKGYNAI